MKSNHWYFLFGALAMGVLAILAGAVISAIPFGSTVTVQPVVSENSAQPGAGARLITVVGTGAVSIAPDVATAQVGVDTQAASPEEATRQNDESVAAVIESLQAAGIDKADIRTVYYNLYAEQRYDRNTGEPTGEFIYRVSTSLSVDVRDLSRLGKVLDGAVKAGANNISSVSFGLEDRAALEASAREKAVADAKARAEALAELSGVRLGEIAAVSEVIEGISPFSSLPVGGGGGSGAPLQPGQLEVTVQVQVSFAIAPQ